MEAYMMRIDGAVSMADLRRVDVNGEDGFEFVENKEYRYLAFAPIGPHKELMPVCSKDGKDFTLCVGAIKSGEKLDVMRIARAIQEKERR